MMRAFLTLSALLAALFAGPLQAQEKGTAGAFDYYVLSLSWTPSWCEAEGDAERSAQCLPGRGHGFTLHGLWPQYEAGWPEFCRSAARDPSRAETSAMADIMGSGGLAWHQWKKHGRCSGLDAEEYFAASREAYGAIRRPEIFRQLPRRVSLPPAVIEAAFLEANPLLGADGVTVTCRAGAVREVRICLSRDLAPRACGRDVRRDCPVPSIEMAPMR